MRALPQLRQEVFAEPKRQLTAKQQRFVSEYLANGGKQTEAAETAGYAKDSAATRAYHLLRLPIVQQAIVKETLTAIGLSAVPALATVIRLSSVAKSDYVKLEAARDLLDRAGYGPPERAAEGSDQNINVSLVLTTEGVSKSAVTEMVTHPRIGKSPAEFEEAVVFPWEGADEAPNRGGPGEDGEGTA
jgi:phage terminase small subunit